MGAKTVVVAGAVLVAGALLVWAPWSRPEPETAAAPPVASAPAEPPSSPRVRVHARAELAPPAPAPARPDVAAEFPAPAPVAATSARERLRRRLDEVDPLLETLVLDQTTGPAVFGRVADATDCPIVLTRRAEAALVAAPLPSPLTFSARIDGERLLLTLPPLAGLTHVVEEDRVVVCAQGEALGPSVEVVVPARPARPEPALVRGTVRDASGRLLGGAEIRHHDGVERVVATSAADGTWSFARRGLGAGSLQFLVARAPGHAGSAATRLAAPIPDEPIDLTLGGPAGAVRVRVTGDAGAVEGARVAIGPAEPRASLGPDGRPTWDLPRSATTGADGTCTIDGVAPGPVSVRATKQGLQPATGSGVVAAGTTVEIDVRVGARPSLAARLAEVRVSVRFTDARVADVVSFLSRASGVNLLVAPDLAAQTVAPVCLALADEPLASALRTLCDQIPGAEIDVREAEGLVLLRSRPQAR